MTDDGPADIVARLRELGSLKMPAEWDPKNWGRALSRLLNDAADEIEGLRAVEDN